MKCKNKNLYEYGAALTVFNNFNMVIPVKISFYLQQNIKLIQQAVSAIEQARLNIGAQFGVLNQQDGAYVIPNENIDIVNKELEDLFNLEQDIPIHIFKLSDFDGIELTYQQISAIMFMIEED